MSLFSMAHSRVMVVAAALSAKAAFEGDDDFFTFEYQQQNCAWSRVRLGEVADNQFTEQQQEDDK